MIQWLQWLMSWRLYWINSREVYLDYGAIDYGGDSNDGDRYIVYLPNKRGEYRVIILDISHRSQALKTDAIINSDTNLTFPETI